MPKGSYTKAIRYSFYLNYKSLYPIFFKFVQVILLRLHVSDVALLGRLKKSKNWLHAMCVALFEEQGIAVSNESDFHVRLFDATHVKEPGKTGSLWRIHYSVQHSTRKSP